jgi:predicted nucleic acid-binding protein
VRVLPDTPIWSAALRRSNQPGNSYREELARLVNHGLVEVIGPIRQEVLSGIRERSSYEAVREQLRKFNDLEITTADYEEAALYFNQCRSKGIQGSATDFLICAVSVRYELAIFTDDGDFQSYRTVLPIRLYRDELHV